MKKILFFILLSLCAYSIFGKDVNSDFAFDMTPTELEKNLYIQGINIQKGIISFITRFESTSHSDYRYEYIVYNYKQNTIIEISCKLWIAQFYEENQIEDWENKKYSVEAFKEIIKDKISQINQKYTLEEFNIKTKSIVDTEVLLKSRTKITRWTEDISYVLKFKYHNKDYSFLEELFKTDIVKNITEVSVYETSDYLIIVQKIARDYFEDDDYYDYIIRGIEK